MPVRLRLTAIFAALVMIILGIFCGAVYYFSAKSREETMNTRLMNRAITRAKLLVQNKVSDHNFIGRIDSLTTISFINKTVQAYDYQNIKFYSYSDIPGDTLAVSKEILDNARLNGSFFFKTRNKEAVAYHYSDGNNKMVVVSAAEDIEGHRRLAYLLNILLISFCSGTAIVLITGYFFSDRLLLPVKKIAADVEEISAQNLARRITTGKTNDEWHYLASTLNQLLDRLQDSFELQRRFISNASHELSTPLTSISSQLEVSLQRDRKPEEYREVMQSVSQDVKNMSKLTQTLLEFAKASGNAGGLEITPIRIDEILLGMPAEMIKINPQFSVSLHFENLPEDQDALLVYGNELLLQLAFKNIVLNACKYSDKFHADIRLDNEHKKISVKVTNHGIGIPEAELDNIFQPFYRAENNTDKDGFGLGLSLAMRIIIIHKGTLNVDSEINKRTEFVISLPVADA